MTRAELAAQILHAMKRLEALGEIDVSPMRIADLITPRPYESAMDDALVVLFEAKQIDPGRTGKGRYRLAPAAYVPEPEALRMDVGG